MIKEETALNNNLQDTTVNDTLEVDEDKLLELAKYQKSNDEADPFHSIDLDSGNTEFISLEPKKNVLIFNIPSCGSLKSYDFNAS